MEFAVVILLSFLLGSIPTAFIVLKKFRDLDIRTEGSGNVGAHNTMDVSESKLLAFLVLAVDFCKGTLAVFLTDLMYGENFILFAVALNTAVLAHNFSPWIKFRGGRGLATAAGASVYFAPAIFILWLLLWTAVYIFRKNMLLANLMATILTAALAFNVDDILNKYSIPPADEALHFSLCFAFMSLLILIKHIQPAIEWWEERKKNYEGKYESD